MNRISTECRCKRTDTGDEAASSFPTGRAALNLGRRADKLRQPSQRFLQRCVLSICQLCFFFFLFSIHDTSSVVIALRHSQCSTVLPECSNISASSALHSTRRRAVVTLWLPENVFHRWSCKMCFRKPRETLLEKGGLYSLKVTCNK